jgi:ubiquinone/menaquinone biosynthesis C-methylase UbiE
VWGRAEVSRPRRSPCGRRGGLSLGLIRQAQAHYQGRIPLAQFDAETLPFREQSFDVVILHQAIYYLSSPQRFIAESRRVLRGNGDVLLIGTVNPQWPDFNPSPMSTRYFSA